MERLKTNKRKIHRKITAISAIPLLLLFYLALFIVFFSH